MMKRQESLIQPIESGLFLFVMLLGYGFFAPFAFGKNPKQPDPSKFYYDAQQHRHPPQIRRQMAGVEYRLNPRGLRFVQQVLKGDFPPVDLTQDLGEMLRAEPTVDCGGCIAGTRNDGSSKPEQKRNVQLKWDSMGKESHYLIIDYGTSD